MRFVSWALFFFIITLVATFIFLRKKLKGSAPILWAFICIFSVFFVFFLTRGF